MKFFVIAIYKKNYEVIWHVFYVVSKKKHEQSLHFPCLGKRKTILKTVKK